MRIALAWSVIAIGFALLALILVIAAHDTLAIYG